VTVAVVLAIVAGCAFAIAAALQHRAAHAETASGLGDPRILVRLAHDPSWLLANVLDIGALGFQAAALHVGAIVVVQPLLVSGLILAVPAEAVLNSRRVSRADLSGVVVGAVALAGFVALADPTEGVDDPALGSWLIVLAGCAVAVAATVGMGRFVTGVRRAVCLGVATGVLYGVTAPLLKTCASLIDQPLALLSAWQLYVLVGAGLLGFVLNQNVYQAGGLAAGLTTLTLVEPVVALVIGVTAFGEHIDIHGGRGVGMALAAVGIAVGIVLAARSSSGAHAVGTA